MAIAGHGSAVSIATQNLVCRPVRQSLTGRLQTQRNKQCIIQSRAGQIEVTEATHIEAAEP